MPKVTITNKKGLVQSSGSGLVVNSLTTATAKVTATAGLQVTHAVPTPAATVTLSVGDNGNRINVIESTASANDSYVLPTAQVAGEWYRFIYGAVAADADNIIFKASAADGLTFEGGPLSLDQNADASTLSTAVKPIYAGGDDDKLTLTNPDGFDLLFTAITTTKYCVSGWCSSTDTHAAFGDI